MFQSRIRPSRYPSGLGPAALAMPLAPSAVPTRSGEAGSSRGSTTLAGFDRARRFFADCFHGVDPARETLFVAYLDRAARCIGQSRHDGDGDTVDWPLRNILLEAARCNCAGLIVAHNHPSGDSMPSTCDRAATRRLLRAADAIDVTLVDHLLFAADECTSFRKMGLL